MIYLTEPFIIVDGDNTIFEYSNIYIEHLATGKVWQLENIQGYHVYNIGATSLIAFLIIDFNTGKPLLTGLYSGHYKIIITSISTEKKIYKQAVYLNKETKNVLTKGDNINKIILE